MKRRITSIVVILIMVLSTLPLIVFSEDISMFFSEYINGEGLYLEDADSEDFGASVIDLKDVDSEDFGSIEIDLEYIDSEDIHSDEIDNEDFHYDAINTVINGIGLIEGDYTDINHVPSNILETLSLDISSTLDFSAFNDSSKTRYTVLLLDTASERRLYPSGLTGPYVTVGASLDKVKQASKKFVEQVIKSDGDNHIAIVSFDTTAIIKSDFSNDYNNLHMAIENLCEGGPFINSNQAFIMADELLSNITDSNAIKNILYFSGGLPTEGQYSASGYYSSLDYNWIRLDNDNYVYSYCNPVYETTQSLMNKGYNIYSLGCFTNLEQQLSTYNFTIRVMKDIQNRGFFDARNPEDLEFIFDDVADDIIRDACPIIVIPGIAGSEMVDRDDGDSKLWFSMFDFTESTITRMGLHPNGRSISNIEPLSTGYGAFNTYKDLVTKLREKYGDGNVYFFAYDWRMDNAETAKELKYFIDNVVRSPKVDIVAHSMGGLVASRYIADGNGDRIRKLITAGTPYLGSPKVPYVFATGRLIEEVGIGIAHKGIKKIVPHMTSAYQLLPYDNADPYIGVFDRRERKWYSITKTDQWNYVPAHDFIRNTLNMTGINDEPISSSVKGNFIDNSIDFMQSIHQVNIADIESIDFHVVVGTGKKTISATIFDSSGGFMYDLSFDDGDGTVPLWSANINNSVSTYPFNYNHTNIVKKEKVIKQIIEILGSKDPANFGDPVNDKPYIVVRVACPVDVTITHNGETLSSVASQSNDNTEFGSLYIIGENNDVKVLALETDDIYDITLQGTDTGTMDFDIRFYDFSNDLIEERSFRDVPITDKTHIWTDTDKDKLTTLFIDSNGDGIVDDIIYPDGYTPNANSYVITAIAGHGGVVTGGGIFESGKRITLTATPDVNYIFDGWYENNVKIDKASRNYSFVVTMNRTLEARFSFVSSGGNTGNGGNAGSAGNNVSNSGVGSSNSATPKWQDIINRINSAKVGDIITIDMKNSTSVPATVFKSLTGKNVTLVLIMSNYTWAINGLNVQDIPSNVRNYDLKAYLIKNGELSALTDNRDVVQLELTHKGPFPFKAELTWRVGIGYEGESLYFYSFNEKNNVLDFIANEVVDNKGDISLTFSHASKYVLTTEILHYEDKIVFPSNDVPVSKLEALFINEIVHLRFVIGRNVYTKNGVSYSNDVAPYIGDDSKTMVPLRTIAEAFGALVDWDGEVHTANINKNGVSLSIKIDQPLPDDMGIPVIISGNTFVPLRYVIENLGATVEWDAVNNTIDVHYKANIVF